MTIFVTACGKTKGPWTSDYIKPRKKYYCDYCEKMRSRKLPFRWVDGLRSCQECNGDIDE